MSVIIITVMGGGHYQTCSCTDLSREEAHTLLRNGNDCDGKTYIALTSYNSVQLILRSLVDKMADMLNYSAGEHKANCFDLNFSSIDGS